MEQVIEVGPSLIRREIERIHRVAQGAVKVAVNKDGFATVIMETEMVTMMSVFYAGTVEKAWMILNLRLDEEV
jgi:hypothetical protein